MKKALLFASTFLIVFLFTGFTTPEKSNANAGIKWMTWDEMQKAQKKQPRKVVVDVYTDWCGWCKKMDASTFAHPEVVKYVNDNFYAIKFDAEMKEPVNFKGKSYNYVPQGNRGYNQLAAEILGGQMSYPTSVYLDENLEPIFPVPGYLDAKTFEKVLNFVHSNSYRTQKFEAFDQAFKGKIQ